VISWSSLADWHESHLLKIGCSIVCQIKQNTMSDFTWIKLEADEYNLRVIPITSEILQIKTQLIVIWRCVQADWYDRMIFIESLNIFTTVDNSVRIGYEISLGFMLVIQLSSNLLLVMNDLLSLFSQCIASAVEEKRLFF
jgi:hypothetical protein